MKKELVTPFSSRMRISDAINELAEMAEGAAFEGEVYTLSEKRKLEGISASATVNRDDSLNADKVHTHTVADVTGLNAIIEGLEARLTALETAGG